MESMKELLVEKYGYTDFEATLTTEDLDCMDEECKKKLEDFLGGEDISSYSCGEFSVDILINEYGLNTISALLSISTLKVDYDNFARMLKKGNK